MGLPLVAGGAGGLQEVLDDVENLPGISVQPGAACIWPESPMILRTILGSCVGVTFWSARLGAGALCHGVLPRCPPGTRVAEGHRYVDFSIRYLARTV